MDDILKLKDLCTKYKPLGLDISIEFNEYGMIFRGRWSTVRNYWDNDVYAQDKTIYFNKIYEYGFLEEYSKFNTLEALLELFKEEFEHEKEARNGGNKEVS